MEVLLGVAMALAGLLLCVTASDRIRLVVAAFLAVPQVYVGPLASLALPLSQCWVIVMAVCWVVERKRLPARDPVMTALVAFTALSAAALLWSPDRMVGALDVARLVSFAFLYAYAVHVEHTDPRGVRTALKTLVGWALVAALLVWLFRLSPATEMAFLRSPLAITTIGPDGMLAFFTAGENNVFDIAKSGGFFINANVASMFLGVSTLACWVLHVEERKRRHLLAALVLWSAVFMTGSKTGAALALLLPVAVRVVRAMGSAAARRFLPQVALAVAGLAWSLPDLIERFVPAYASASAHSMSDRTHLWSAAARMFAETPVLGNGHGGWLPAYQFHGGGVPLPPHNLVIAAWSDAGLLGATALVVLICLLLRAQVAAVLESAGLPLSRVAACVLGVWAWVVMHGFGDNTKIYGESKSMTLLAVLLGLVAARVHALRQESGTAAVPSGATRAAGAVVLPGPPSGRVPALAGARREAPPRRGTPHAVAEPPQEALPRRAAASGRAPLLPPPRRPGR